MLRVMEGKIRAFLSNRYLRLDHHEVTCAVIPEIGTIPDVQFVSNQITEDHLYMKAIIPHLQREVLPGRTIQAGLMIRNSETGLGTFTVVHRFPSNQSEFQEFRLTGRAAAM